MTGPLIMPDRRRFHLTPAKNLPSIMEKGLLPDAKKLFVREWSGTPSFGGIYYTRNLFDIPCIFRNMTKTGVFAHDSLAILSFQSDGETRIDEDDYIAVSTEKGNVGATWIGNDEAPEGLLELYRDFLVCGRKEREYLALESGMRDFFEKMKAKNPDPDKGNMLDPVPPGNIVIEAVLTPYIDDNDHVAWKGCGENAAFFAEVFDSLDVSPGLLDHYWPYECALRHISEFSTKENEDGQGKRDDCRRLAQHAPA